MTRKPAAKTEKNLPQTTQAAPPPTTQMGQNYFESYGSQVSQKAIVGQLLKFNKGDWLVGEANEEVEIGTRFVCNMDQLMVGWLKWVDNKPDQQIMGLVVEGYQPPRRHTLGDDDKTQWEIGTDGKERDPWQFSNYLIMKTPGEPGIDEELYTFATSSRGGLNAIGDLCKTYGKAMRTRPDEYPIIEIGVGKYNHPNKEYGIIKFPTLTVVDWEAKDVFAATEGTKKKGSRKAA